MIQLEDKLYTSTEVANILGVSLRSVYRYLEEGKINAEVKTATGRHRFSKINILDFLYPDGKDKPRAVEETSNIGQAEPAAKKKIKVEPKPEPVAVEPEQVPAEEPIDWLAKFREAAQKYREEAAQTPKVSVPSAQDTEVSAMSMSMADMVKISDEPAFAESVPVAKKPKQETRNYYRSNLGGLKEIAQNIDKGSRNSYLDYAFTLNAGLSLFKPIKPFSLLHAYIREDDLAFYEKLLGLTPTDEANSQLCLILTNIDEVFKDREEMHGLYVVSKKRLYDDVQKLGDSTLVSEATSILK